MSLRDQLLKAGLVSSEQVKQAEKSKKAQTHQAKKTRKPVDPEAEQVRRAQEAEAAAKRERDRQLERERQGKRQQREAMLKARQLMDAHRVNDPKAEHKYNFSHNGKVIRSVRVTESQQRLLGMGKLGIIRNDRDPYDYPLVPREIAEKIQALGPGWVMTLHDENDGSDDDWPADWV